ncbi:MAG: carboxypeptidase-like regulatory domain-containing protein [Oscillospiraceae bacterium]|nr:carboxypeptidase-like regulatory domain-containing protein [Oscillospiraceae bacterium]
MTDVNGKFSLTMANDAVLQVSFLGYVTREVSITSVGEGQPLAIIMEEESKTLDEVVVVGYGFQKKATLSGSVSAISGNEIVKSPAMNVSNSLAGSL